MHLSRTNHSSHKNLISVSISNIKSQEQNDMKEEKMCSRTIFLQIRPICRIVPETSHKLLDRWEILWFRTSLSRFLESRISALIRHKDFYISSKLHMQSTQTIPSSKQLKMIRKMMKDLLERWHLMNLTTGQYGLLKEMPLTSVL